MNYQQTLDFLFSQLPMYQRDGAAALKPNLNNITTLCDALGNPEQKFRSIHIAGTNGKGSVSHMLASVLQNAGYKVGLYTSPHLKDFRERIKINGEVIPENEVVLFVEKHKELFSTLKPSFFEMTVSMAFDYFATQQVDIAVIETGLGGRLDATNIIKPILSVITNISSDHTYFLGTELSSIATEKAGIIKTNTPVVIGESHTETKNVFMDTAHKKNAPILFADEIYQAKNITHSTTQALLKLDIFTGKTLVYKDVQCDLLGLYQQKNGATVLAAISLLQQLAFTISVAHIYNGLQTTVATTGLLGRWQILSNNPLTIADIGHNEDGIKEVCKQLALTPHTHLHFVLGVVNDKDLANMLINLPKTAIYYFCKANISRGLNAKELQQQALTFNLKGNIYQSVNEAIADAKRQAKTDDLIFIGGSAFVVAEAI
jgi:dihydrofolate synthase / folylpolyglutamate synthase